MYVCLGLGLGWECGTHIVFRKEAISDSYLFAVNSLLTSIRFVIRLWVGMYVVLARSVECDDAVS